MKIKLIALSLCLFTGVNLAKAQEASKNLLLRKTSMSSVFR